MLASNYSEKRDRILRKKREGGFKKSYVPLHGGRGVKNHPNRPYVINEWPLSTLGLRIAERVAMPCLYGASMISCLNYKSPVPIC